MYIKHIILFLPFNVLSFCAFAQTININKALDSIINNTFFNKPMLIQVMDYDIIIDTISVKKMLACKSDSSIFVKFSNNLSKKIKNRNLWGEVTDFNERRRFFNGDTYLIWRTKAPYIYIKVKSHNSVYYFSDSLTSNIYLLNPENINVMISDSISKIILYNFIHDNYFVFSQEKNKNIANEVFEAFIGITKVLDFVSPLFINDSVFSSLDKRINK